MNKNPVGGKKPGAGRPRKQFSPETKKIFENLCKVQCTINEIEAVMTTNQVILDRMCQHEYGVDLHTAIKRFSEGGKASLRRLQFRLAEKSPAMAIFLGKNNLGQADQINQKIETKQEISQKAILELPDNGRRFVTGKD